MNRGLVCLRLHLEILFKRGTTCEENWVVATLLRRPAVLPVNPRCVGILFLILCTGNCKNKVKLKLNFVFVFTRKRLCVVR